uniref:alpha/beta hydrolase family protein n=1 Tax=Sphingomonas bacterium TaxID=1895847 RepID=UPI0026327315|nr:hypothetical protein [Sphingomonas bacterium]
MKACIMALAAVTAASMGQVAAAQEVPAAISTDPVHDAAHPARMEVLHIPSGGVAINGLAYVAAGAGPHPVVLLCHGLPGNEKNLDLAQAMRRAGWTVITFTIADPGGAPAAIASPTTWRMPMRCSPGCARPPMPRSWGSTRRGSRWSGTAWAGG